MSRKRPSLQLKNEGDESLDRPSCPIEDATSRSYRGIYPQKPAGISTISLPHAKIHTFAASFMVMKRTNCVEKDRGMLHALPYRALSVCQLFRALPQLPDKQGQVYMHCLVIICVQHPISGRSS